MTIIPTRLDLSRKRGRGWRIFIDASIQGVEDTIKKYKEKLITVASYNIGNIRTNRKNTKKTRKQKWKEKQLYGYFKRQTDEIVYEKNWT